MNSDTNKGTSTFRESIQRHRQTGRGRKATWIAAGLAALLATIWMAPAISGRGQASHFGGHFGESRHGRSFSELAAELREHGRWVDFAGLTDAQADQLAALIDERAPVLDDLESRRVRLVELLSEVFAAADGDIEAAGVEALRTDAKRLADQAIDESLDAFAEVAARLTPEQRADVLRHWRHR